MILHGSYCGISKHGKRCHFFYFSSIYGFHVSGISITTWISGSHFHYPFMVKETIPMPDSRFQLLNIPMKIDILSDKEQQKNR